MVQPGAPVMEFDTPALIIDLDAVERNVARMAQFLADKPARLRPHFKTHKCIELARRQMAAGAIGMTAAKVSEAEVLVQSGVCDDVLIANEVVGRQKADRLMQLAKRARMMVAVDSQENVAELAESAAAAKAVLRVLVDIDVGMGRCGVRRIEDAVALARQVDRARYLEFAGVMGWEGHACFIEDRAKRTAAGRDAMARLIAARDAVIEAALPVGIVSSGGTGTFDVSGTYPGVTEIQSGSYILMDARYGALDLGFENALTCLVTVISRPEPDLAITDAGRKALSEEFGFAPPLDLPGAESFRSSEEHGFIRLSGSEAAVGRKIRVLPTHVCTTVNLHDTFYAVRNGLLEAVYPIAARGKIQ